LSSIAEADDSSYPGTVGFSREGGKLNLDLTEEQKLLQPTVRDFAENEIKPLARELDETDYPGISATAGNSVDRVILQGMNGHGLRLCD
jgi:hypothetical protein